jgi:hypothetical protein
MKINLNGYKWNIDNKFKNNHKLLFNLKLLYEINLWAKINLRRLILTDKYLQFI